MGAPDEAVARSQTASNKMHTGFATLATEAESDDAIDEDRDAVGGRDDAGRKPAADQPATAP